MRKRHIDEKTLTAVAMRSTRASAKLELRVVPPDFKRSPEAEKFLEELDAKRR